MSHSAPGLGGLLGLHIVGGVRHHEMAAGCGGVHERRHDPGRVVVVLEGLQDREHQHGHRPREVDQPPQVRIVEYLRRPSQITFDRRHPGAVGQ
jgi:hypothetical protein